MERNNLHAPIYWWLPHKTSRPDVFYKIGVLKNFVKMTGVSLSIRLEAWPKTLLQKIL